MPQTRRKGFELPFVGEGPEPVSNAWRGENDAVIQKLMSDGFVERLARNTLRLNLGLMGGSGLQTTYVLSRSVSVRVIDAVLPNSVRAHFIADVPLLQLRASLSVDCAYTLPGLKPMVFSRPEIVLIYVPQGAEIQFDLVSSSRQQGVQLYMDARHFLRHFELEPASLPPLLRSALEGKSEAGRLIVLPMEARMAAVVEAMTQPIRSYAMQQLFIRGKLQELVALTLDAASRNQAFAGSTAFRQRDIDLAYEARALLDVHYASPPRFPDLAHSIGTNQNKLKILFREIFGTTMADYCVERRIRQAQGLLLEGRLSVGEIAERVGYEHQSSFTAAFKGHAGMTPKKYQRHRAALDVPLSVTSSSIPVRSA